MHSSKLLLTIETVERRTEVPLLDVIDGNLVKFFNDANKKASIANRRFLLEEERIWAFEQSK